VNYCGVECYKSDRHQDCSELFYKAEVEKVLRSEEVSISAKKEMIEMLKRDQEERMEDERDLCDMLVDERRGLVDGDDFDTLMSQLTVDERKLFEAAIESNSIIESLGAELVLWWRENFAVIPEELSRIIPALLSVPALPSAFKPHPTTELFVADLIVGYCFVYRRYVGEPEDLIVESTDELVELCLAFNPEARIDETTFLHTTIQQLAKVADRKTCAIAFEDAAQLLDNQLKIRHALSHISSLLSAKGQSKEKKRLAKKVDFYHSWILSGHTPNALAPRLKSFHKKLLAECDKFEEDRKVITEKIANNCLVEPVHPKPLIVELES